MKKVEAYINPHKLTDVTIAFQKMRGFPGMSVAEVKGSGRREPKNIHTCIHDLLDFSRYMRIEIFCGDEGVEEIVTLIAKAAHTGLRGDGKIYVSPVETAI